MPETPRGIADCTVIYVYGDDNKEEETPLAGNETVERKRSTTRLDEARRSERKRLISMKMELVNSGTVEMLSRRSVAIKDYDDENGDEDEEPCDESDRTSLKIDLSMAEQFYYEVISSFEQEEVHSTKT